MLPSTASPTIKKSLYALAAAAAVGALCYFLFKTSTFIPLLYGVLFVLLGYFVGIFRGGARDAALLLASLVFGLGAIEIVALTLSASKPKNPSHIIEKGAYTGDPELGWGPANPGVFRERKIAADGTVIFDFSATIDDQLTRKVVSSDDGPVVAFFGDSFTYGLGVADADTLPQSFADATGRKFRVVNFGVPGYGPQQFLRALETDFHAALLKRNPRLFVMLTTPWHAGRTACKTDFMTRAPRYALSGGAPVYSGVCPARDANNAAVIRWIMNAVRSTASYSYFVGAPAEPIERADVDLYLAILAKAGQLAREKYDVPTLLLYAADDLSKPLYHLGPGYSNDDIMRKLRDSGLLVIDATLDPKAYPGQTLFIPGDNHPTGVAHRLWAGQLKDFMAKNGESLDQKPDGR